MCVVPVVACQRGDSPSAGAPAAARGVPLGSNSVGSRASALASGFPAPSASAAPAGAGPPLAISVDAPGEFTLQAGVALNVASVARIETRSDAGRWTALKKLDLGKGYSLTEGCSPAVPACRSFAAGERLTPAPWSGFGCSAQCVPKCALDEFHPGTHRLVVSDCQDSSKHYESAPFEMVASARMLARLRASANIRQATVFRLEASAIKPQDSRPPLYVATNRVIPETVRPLDPALITELATWLSSADGFVSLNLFKRCSRRELLGFILTSDTPHGRTATEVSVDLLCDSLVLGTTDGRGVTWTESFFDPSYARILSIAQRALPLDRELAALPPVQADF